MRIEFFNELTQSWLSSSCDFEDACYFETEDDAKKRAEELREENEDILFRVME